MVIHTTTGFRSVGSATRKDAVRLGTVGRGVAPAIAKAPLQTSPQPTDQPDPIPAPVKGDG